MGRCSICHTLIREDDETAECSTCFATYHAACWDELGGCATYGCDKAPAAEKPPVGDTGGGWGDSKACPACGRELHPSDLDCRRCGSEFPHADPMTRDEFSRWERKKGKARGNRRLILGLFIASLLGFTAPGTGLAAGLIAWTHRESLAGEDGTYLALGYGAGALGVLYTLLVLILATGA